MALILVLYFLILATCEGDVCKIKGTCPIMDGSLNPLVMPQSHENAVSTESTTFSSEDSDVSPPDATTEESSTTIIGSTPRNVFTTPSPTTNIQNFVKKTMPSLVCWCDVTVNLCDVNCCCDYDCSAIQKQVFTHCANLKTANDLKSCYSSDLFFKKPKSTQIIETDDLFCVVRENLAMKNEYKPHQPIRSIEEFDRELRRQRLELFPLEKPRIIFSNKVYMSGSVVWTIRRGVLVPLEIPHTLFGDLCLSSKTVGFLHEITTKCIVSHLQSSSRWLIHVIDEYFEVKLVATPQLMNTSDIGSSIKNCSNNKSCVTAMPLFCRNFPSVQECVKLNSTTAFKSKGSALKGAAIELIIHQNASEGITAATTQIWTLPTAEFRMSVKYLWVNTTRTPFIRSGNPGYIIGKPVLAGTKVAHFSNDTGVREAIQLTYDPKGWLTTFSGLDEECPSTGRAPILFNDKRISSCSLKLTKNYFSKNGCLELQKSILKQLLGENINVISADEVRLFVGCYGNSKVEDLGDWVAAVVDSFPLISSQVSFDKTSDGLWCKGITTSLYVDIAFSKFGPFTQPQSKIVGVLFRFGQAKSLHVSCYSKDCETFSVGSLKLNMFVNFVDISSPPVHEFARPPGLKAKLPHDFFYPFFSGKGAFVCPSLSLTSFIVIFIANKQLS